MSDFVCVGDARDIAPGTGKPFTVGRFDIAVFNVAGDYFALENVCPHQGSPIADGSLEGPLLTCPWHAWCFDVRSGQMTLGEFSEIPQFDVRVEGGRMWISSEPRVRT